MNIKIISLFFVIILSMIGVIADFFIKLSGNGAKFVDLKWFIVGMVIYGLTAFGWFFVMKNIKLTTLGVFYSISTIIFLALVGVFYFKESINNYEVIGIILAIASLILLGRFA
jgi:small multidrug resistance pump